MVLQLRAPEIVDAPIAWMDDMKCHSDPSGGGEESPGVHSARHGFVSDIPLLGPGRLLPRRQPVRDDARDKQRGRNKEPGLEAEGVRDEQSGDRTQC